MEPFSKRTKLDKFRIDLGYDFAYSNASNKIWILCDRFLNCTILEDHIQHITCSISDNDLFMTLVYASCEHYIREALWENIRIFSDSQYLWMVAGDFNSIVSPEEKLGGIPHNMTKSLPFIYCIMETWTAVCMISATPDHLLHGAIVGNLGK